MDVIEATPPFKLVRARHGVFLASWEDVYIGRSLLSYGEYAELEWDAISQVLLLRGDGVEVGSNIGAFTVPMAKALAARGRRLWAVEAQPMIYRQLCANLALNALMNVQVENLACSDAPGWLSFDAPDCTREFNFGAVSMLAEGQGRQRVRAVRLDDLLPADANVGLLKVDVEGFEQRVLQGAKATIERCRPVIYLENDRLDRSQALIEWLWAAGYRMAWHVPPMFNPNNFAGQSQDLYPRVASFNMLAVPNESKIELPGHLLVNNAKHHPLRPASAG